MEKIEKITLKHFVNETKHKKTCNLMKFMVYWFCSQQLNICANMGLHCQKV